MPENARQMPDKCPTNARQCPDNCPTVPRQLPDSAPTTTASARDAASAADIRQAFFESCAGSVPKKEVGLRLARKGFAEESANFWVGVARTKRRVYRLNFPDSAGAYVALQARPGSTGGS